MRAHPLPFFGEQSKFIGAIVPILDGFGQDALSSFQFVSTQLIAPGGYPLGPVIPDLKRLEFAVAPNGRVVQLQTANTAIIRPEREISTCLRNP